MGEFMLILFVVVSNVNYFLIWFELAVIIKSV